MSEEKVLTKAIAEQFLDDDSSVDLKKFTGIQDEAAEVLAGYDGGGDLEFDALTSLSLIAAGWHDALRPLPRWPDEPFRRDSR